MEINGKPLEGNQLVSADPNNYIQDADWIATAFLVPDSDFEDPDDVTNRYWSTASAKFTDSRLGANIGINPRPQFCMYSDVPDKGRLSGRTDPSIYNSEGNYGLGRYYSDAIDDHAQRIYITFGVPQFNSLTSFLTRAFDAEQMRLARTGRATSVFYSAARNITRIGVSVAFPSIALSVWAVGMANKLFGKPTSKFYTLKPTMHLYWSTVDQLVNTGLVARGIMPKIAYELSGPLEQEYQRLGRPLKLDPEYLEGLRELMPGVFGSQYNIDTFSVVNQAQRLANKMFQEDFDALNKGTATNFEGVLKKNLTGSGRHATPISNVKGEPTLAAFMNRISMFSYWKNNNDPNENVELDPGREVGDDSTDGARASEDQTSFSDYMDALFRDGALFATFIVNHTGSVSESFSSSSAESSMANDLNSASAEVRDARFSMAEGNILPGSIGGAVEGAIKAVGDVATGIIDGATFGVTELLRGLGGNGFIDILKYWQSSNVTLPSSSYSIDLIPPYGNPISQVMNIDIPLYMLLAGALPRSMGYSAYGSPFICRMFDPGRSQIATGMITQLSVTRGTTNLAFNKNYKAMGVKVDFTFENFSTIMHMPISSGKIGDLNMSIDENNILSDYIAVLSGQDIYSQIYPMTKAKINLAKKIMANAKLTSTAYYASVFHNSLTSGALQYLTFGAGKVIEAAARGTSTIGTAIQ